MTGSYREGSIGGVEGMFEVAARGMCDVVAVGFSVRRRDR